MKFQAGRYYKHNNGKTMAIIGALQTSMWCAGPSGFTLIAETSDGKLEPVGSDATSAENWAEMSRDEWMAQFS